MGNDNSKEAQDAEAKGFARAKEVINAERDREFNRIVKQKAAKRAREVEDITARRQDSVPSAGKDNHDSEDNTSSQSEPIPIRTRSSSQTAGSSLLAAFEPRKERLGKEANAREDSQPEANSLSTKLRVDTRARKPLASQNGESSLVKTPAPVKPISTNANPAMQKSIAPAIAMGAAGKPSSIVPSSATSQAPSAKRQMLTNPYTDERRPSLSSLPKIPKRSTVASPKSPDRVEVGQQLATVGEERPPKWYTETPQPKSRGKNGSSADLLLQRLRDQVTKCKTNFVRGTNIQNRVLANIREILHDLMFESVSEPLLKSRRMLHNQDGLPQFFDPQYSGGVKWPFDIKADATELYNKWYRRVFETDLMRGIKFTMKATKAAGDSGGGDSIDPLYKGTVSANYFGKGDLLNGQWWPLQICALRDGAHGATQGGIHGKAGEGAYSCVMSGGEGYDDEDYGDIVLYCGTDSKDGSISDHTLLLIENTKNSKPVRLMRSSKAKGTFKPSNGFRYDGLYSVVSYENLDQNSEKRSRQRHRFRLERRPGQDPIRGGEGPEGRPTDKELKEYTKHTRNLGRSA